MNTRSSGRKKQAKFFGIPPGMYHGGGGYKKKAKDFSCKSRDGRELKIYLGMGCIPGNYGINDLLAKYPQFQIYDKSSLSSAFNRLKKKSNSLSFEQSGLRNNKNNGKLHFTINKFILFIN